jgi:hypothetical protein
MAASEFTENSPVGGVHDLPAPHRRRHEDVGRAGIAQRTNVNGAHSVARPSHRPVSPCKSTFRPATFESACAGSTPAGAMGVGEDDPIGSSYRSYSSGPLRALCDRSRPTCSPVRVERGRTGRRRRAWIADRSRAAPQSRPTPSSPQRAALRSFSRTSSQARSARVALGSARPRRRFSRARVLTARGCTARRGPRAR